VSRPLIEQMAQARREGTDARREELLPLLAAALGGVLANGRYYAAPTGERARIALEEALLLLELITPPPPRATGEDGREHISRRISEVEGLIAQRLAEEKEDTL
jgi:hypothetical protein